MPKKTDFSDLLSKAQKLSAEIQHEEELPTVKRNLQQIAEAGQRLLSKTTGVVDESTGVKAAILLGSRGFDVPKLSQKLENLSSVKTLEPIEPVWETDIQGFLRNERENTLLAIIEESRKNTFSESERHHWECMESEWDKEKQKILDSLLGSNQGVEFPVEADITHSTPLSLHGKSALDAMAMSYAVAVYHRNEATLNKLSYEMVTACQNASTKFVDKQARDAWYLMKELVAVVPQNMAGSNSRRDMATQRLFMLQARKYLENTYKRYIQETVHQSPAVARLGGQPGTRNLVKAYLKIRRIPPAISQKLEDGTVDNVPVWALVFYCLRCGDLADAVGVLSEAGSCEDLAPHLREYMKDYRLSSTSENKLQLLYKRSVRNSSDPFKRAVYCVLAGCDVHHSDHTEVCCKTDDYMWLKICQLSFDESVHPHRSDDKLTLSQLQHLMLEEYGEQYFNGSQQPYIYFKVLLLTLQFEAAIEFLSRVDTLQVHAVHFAIALYDLKLLHLTESTQNMLLVKDPVVSRRLNFARLIVRYTRQFALTNVKEALQYFYLLKGLQDSQKKDLFHVCVSELVMESKEFELLLGRVSPDGSVREGAVGKFKMDTSELVGFVADNAEEKGLYEDAIHLYDLAKNHTKVMELLNRQLSAVASSPANPQSDRERLQVLAVTIAERYRTLGHTQVKSHISQTFHLLLDIMQFFDLYHAGHSDTALQVMKQLQILPLQADEAVEKKVEQFRNYDNEIRHCLPDMLLATMSILFATYRQSEESSSKVGVTGGQDGGVEMYKDELRKQARQLIVFAGMLPYQMPGDTNARLVQMEVYLR